MLHIKTEFINKLRYVFYFDDNKYYPVGCLPRYHADNAE